MSPPTAPQASAGSVGAAQQATPYSWYVAIILMLVYTIHFVDRSVINAVIEPIREEFKLSDFEIGVLAGPAYAIAFAIVGIPLGLLIDRVNRRNLLAGLLATWSLLTALSGLAGSFAHLLMARVAVGAAEAGGSPTAMSILADYFPPHRRATATGVFFLSVTLGVLIGYGVTGVVAATYGWRAAFFVAGAPGLLMALVLLLTVREPPRGRFDAPTAAGEPMPRIGAVLRALWLTRPLRYTLAGIVVAATVTSGFNAFVVSLLVRTHDLPLGSAAVTIAMCVGLGGGAGSVFFGWLGDAIGRHWRSGPSLMIAAATVFASGFGCLGVLAPSLPLAVAGLAGFSFFIASFMGSGYGLLLNLAPVAVRGSSIATSQVLINLLGFGAGPVIAGGLSVALEAATGQPGLPLALAALMAINLAAAAAHAAAASGLRRPPGTAAEMT